MGIPVCHYLRILGRGKLQLTQFDELHACGWAKVAELTHDLQHHHECAASQHRWRHYQLQSNM